MTGTIIFADLAGFTAWSSERDPAQVFTLLEQIYALMDKVAKKSKVFKVHAAPAAVALALAEQPYQPILSRYLSG
jgi:class 3 adenylate cyclase